MCCADNLIGTLVVFGRSVVVALDWAYAVDWVCALLRGNTSVESHGRHGYTSQDFSNFEHRAVSAKNPYCPLLPFVFKNPSKLHPLIRSHAIKGSRLCVHKKLFINTSMERDTIDWDQKAKNLAFAPSPQRLKKGKCNTHMQALEEQQSPPLGRMMWHPYLLWALQTSHAQCSTRCKAMTRAKAQWLKKELNLSVHCPPPISPCWNHDVTHRSGISWSSPRAARLTLMGIHHNPFKLC